MWVFIRIRGRGCPHIVVRQSDVWGHERHGDSSPSVTLNPPDNVMDSDIICHWCFSYRVTCLPWLRHAFRLFQMHPVAQCRQQGTGGCMMFYKQAMTPLWTHGWSQRYDMNILRESLYCVALWTLLFVMMEPQDRVDSISLRPFLICLCWHLESLNLLQLTRYKVNTIILATISAMRQ